MKTKNTNKDKNDIFVAPVKKYTPPKYPTQTEAKFKPELLKKLPSRWQKNAAVVAAAGLFGAMTITLTSCGFLETFDSEDKTKGYNPDSEKFLNVAPVFVHGEGTGYMGCMMIAPPVFLSEQEALAIIKSVAEDEGLNFESEPPEYIATSNKKVYEKKYSWVNYPDNEYLGNGNIKLDLYDEKTEVAISYISMEKGQRTTETYSGISLTPENIEAPPMNWNSYPRELAEMTVEDFAQQNGDINIGVFYEPGWYGEKHNLIINGYHAKGSEIWEKYFDEEKQEITDENREKYNKEYEEVKAEYKENVKLLIEEDLRAQVRDFIEWLQGQGII